MVQENPPWPVRWDSVPVRFHHLSHPQLPLVSSQPLTYRSALFPTQYCWSISAFSDCPRHTVQPNTPDVATSWVRWVQRFRASRATALPLPRLTAWIRKITNSTRSARGTAPMWRKTPLLCPSQMCFSRSTSTPLREPGLLSEKRTLLLPPPKDFKFHVSSHMLFVWLFAMGISIPFLLVHQMCRLAPVC